MVFFCDFLRPATLNGERLYRSHQDITIRIFFAFFTLASLFLSPAWADPIISEFLASNDSEYADEDGEYSDWIEIHNPDPVAVDMAGWHLTDNAGNLDKWTFPSVSIPANGYLVVFASNKDRAGSELHTNFKLSSGGEYLALVKPDGVTRASEFNPFPAQNTDVSYGVDALTTLLGREAALSYVLAAPAADAQGDLWTEHDYDDSGWTSDAQEASTYSSTNVPMNATDYWYSSGPGVATSNLFVNNQNSPVSSVTLRFIIARDSGSDLQVKLRSPRGTEVTVFSNGWNSTSFVLTMTNFNNENLNGNWSLTLTESGAGWTSRTSRLHSWSLEMPNGTVPAKAGIGYDTEPDYTSLINTTLPTGTTEAWVRFPFEVADPASLSSLLLRLRYDDGFEAYLNGTLVASANVSAPVQGVESAGFVDFDISSYLSSLRTGANVLAVKMVNAGAGSSDFLLVPELVATNLGSSLNYVYLTEPSPGVANQGGQLNPGPVISEVTDNPAPLGDADALVVTAHVLQRDAAVNTVTLRYRVGYGVETSLGMSDDGTGGDAVAGDGVYSATIPASASGPGDMLRWTVVATDAGGKESRMPLQADNTGNSQSPEYYGTVINSTINGTLPVMQWFTQDEPASRTRTGARASVYYAGKFYDNIFVRQRGGYTNGGSQKFDFNKGFPLFVNETLPAVGEINMNANGADSSYVRQSLGFNFFNTAGNAGCESFPVQMRLNGSYDRVGILIEQVDEDFLARFGYDPEGGELYKFVQRSGSGSTPSFNDTSTGVERKTGDQNDLSSMQALVDDLKQGSSGARVASFYDNMDVQQFVNYMAVRCVLQMADDVRKNFYMYKDAAGDGRWRILPWDLDWSLGIGDHHGATRIEHPFFGIQAFPTDDGLNQWNRLLNVAFEDVEMQRLYLRRVRTLMDQYLLSSPTGSWFETRVDEIFNSMSGLSGPSSGDYTALRNTEIPERRGDLFNQMTTSISGMSVVIPAAQPGNPDVVIDEVDFNPAGGDQDQEYIRLTNNEATEIDISGWSISSGVGFTFPPGTVIPRNGTLYVSPKLKKFVTRSASPTGGERRLVTGPYSGHLSSFGEDLALKNAAGATVQTYTHVGNPSDAQQYLVISEFLYHPLSNPAAEFIEVTNISASVTVDLTGVHFSNGVDFSFTGSAVTSLAPGESVLVVKDQAAFEAVYGTGLSSRIAGEFAGGTELNNGGEGVKLDDATSSTIHSFTYSSASPWPAASGASLVLLNPDTRPDHADPSNWVASRAVGGSPAGGGSQFAAWLAARGQTDPLAEVDGWTELATYALGRDLAGAGFVYGSTVETFNVGGEDGLYLTLETTVRDVGDTSVVPQLASDLTDWADATVGVDVVLVSDTDNGDGTRTMKWRSATEVTAGGRQFIRVKVSGP